MWSVFVPFYKFLNPGFNCSKRFISFSIDKLTTWTYFVSVILNSNAVGGTIAGLLPCAFLVTQFLDQVKINYTSQLISGIFKLL